MVEDKEHINYECLMSHNKEGCWRLCTDHLFVIDLHHNTLCLRLKSLSPIVEMVTRTGLHLANSNP
jgi:hypothetical protein